MRLERGPDAATDRLGSVGVEHTDLHPTIGSHCDEVLAHRGELRGAGELHLIACIDSEKREADLGESGLAVCQPLAVQHIEGGEDRPLSRLDQDPCLRLEALRSAHVAIPAHADHRLAMRIDAKAPEGVLRGCVVHGLQRIRSLRKKVTARDATRSNRGALC